MRKLKRRERKALNAGYSEGYKLGYAEGYAKGLYEGNPFNKMIECLSSVACSIQDAIKDNPELLAELNKRNTDEDDYEEGGDNE